MFCLQRSKSVTQSAESNHQTHNAVENAAGRFPFAIQHLLGIDASAHHRPHHHDVSHFTRQQQQQSTSSQPTTDDVTYGAWTCPPSDVTPTTWYRGTDAMMLDDVISSVNVRRQSSLPTLASHGRLAAAAAGLGCLPSPTSLLPVITDNVSGKLHSQTQPRCMSVSEQFHLKHKHDVIYEFNTPQRTGFSTAVDWGENARQENLSTHK